MFTSILAMLTVLVGVAVIVTGVWSVVVLITEKPVTPVPLRHYTIAIGMIGVGVGLLCIAQALRILLLILAKVTVIPP